MSTDSGVKWAENVTFRVLSAIGIVCVVMGHMGCHVLEFGGWIPYYSFHLPLFAFASGYFYRRENDITFSKFVMKKIKTLVVPFYGISLIYLLISTCLRSYEITFGLDFSFYNWIIRPWLKCQPLGFGIATWFMIALFLAEIVYASLRQFVKTIKDDRSRDAFLLLLIGILAIIVISKSPYPEEWQKVFLRPVFFALYVHIGFCYRVYFENVIRIPMAISLFFMFIIRALIMSKYGGCDYGLWDCNFGGLPWHIVIVNTTIGIFFWLEIAKTIAPVLSKDGWIVRLGRHTREIMSNHLFAAFIWQGFVYRFEKLFYVESSFDILAYKSQLYYHYCPWKGYSFALTVASVGIVMLGVEIKKRCMERIKATNGRGIKIWREYR